MENTHYTSEPPSDKKKSLLKYGPYTDLAPLSFDQLQIFYTYPYPLPVFSTARRDIQVSHWGSVSVDEFFEMANEAAGIKGQFSRIDYMPLINPNQG